MISSSTSTFMPLAEAESPAQAQATSRPRRITPEAGRALEKLAHAIEYLSDEFVHDAVLPDLQNGRLQAIQLLMSLNRAVYFDCPEIPGFWARLRSVFRRFERARL